LQQKRKTTEEEEYIRLRREGKVFVEKEERMFCERVETSGNSNIL
jgi:hypothetical protein